MGHAGKAVIENEQFRRRRSRDFSGNLLTFCLAVVIALGEGLLIFLCAHGTLNSWFLAVFHFAVLAMLVYFVRAIAKSERDLRYPLLLLILTFGAGPLGACGLILQIAIFPLFQLFSTSAEDWLEGLFPKDKQTPFAHIYQRIRSGWDDYAVPNEVASFQDIFSYGTLEQKQAVLDAIVKDYHPFYAPILKNALNDERNTVRIQAAAIVSKIDFNFEQDLMRLLVKANDKKDDPSLQLEFAEHYDACLLSDIFDAVREKELGGLAIHYYREYLKSLPNDRISSFAILRILFRIKEYEDFLAEFEVYKKRFKIIPGIVQAWKLESLYNLQRYDELADAVREK